MAIASTASSGTEEPEEPIGPTGRTAEDTGTPRDGSEEPSAPTHDPARRAFFKEFGRQAVNAMGQVAGMADIVGRTSSAAAASLLGLDERRPLGGLPAPPRPGRVTGSPGAATGAVARLPSGDDTFRSPYRLAGDALVLLDQRGIPERFEELTARRGSDVAYYLRLGACRGAPVMAQVAAYGLALTAAERHAQPAEARALELRRTRDALARARPSARLLRWAMERMAAVEERLGSQADAPGIDRPGAIGPDVDLEAARSEADAAALAAALRAEADAIAAGMQADHASIARHLEGSLPEPAGRPLTLLLHGDPGAMSGGLIGPVLAALRALAERDRPLRVFLTEGRPFMEGARLASWELRQAGISHRVVPDAAVAWLLAREPLDIVLTEATWIAANGDAAGLIGSRAIAQVVAAAAAGRDQDSPDAPRPRLVVVAPSATLDPATPDGAAIPDDLRPARELGAYLAGVPVRAPDAIVPATDVMPAGAVDSLVTERGVVSPVSAEAIAGLLGSGRGASID